MVTHVTGDLNKAISFVVGVLSTSFARAYSGSSIRARDALCNYVFLKT